LQPVAKWTLKNAVPQSWKGPQLSATGKGVAMETLEIVHEGFLDD
jgi:phage tail-like protein